MKHGLLSRSGLLPGEDPRAFQQFYEKVFTELAPESAVEEALVADIIWTMWRLQRIPGIEAGRHIWNRYAIPYDLVYQYDEQQFRARIAQADRASQGLKTLSRRIKPKSSK